MRGQVRPLGDPPAKIEDPGSSWVILGRRRFLDMCGSRTWTCRKPSKAWLRPRWPASQTQPESLNEHQRHPVIPGMPHDPFKCVTPSALGCFAPTHLPRDLLVPAGASFVAEDCRTFALLMRATSLSADHRVMH
jgi:hypothetical protein